MNAVRHRYGKHRWQVADLWLPGPEAPGPPPVVVMVHGGYWRSWYTKSLMNRLCRDVVARGWAAWNIEYRRVGPWGGGGWPNTLADVGAAVDHLAQLPAVDASRALTCGHSSGGHLALWAAARHRAPAGTPGTPPEVRPGAAIALAGVVDLELGAELRLGDGAVERFMGGPPKAWPERYAGASPAALLPLGVPQLLVHGLADTVVPPMVSERYQRAAALAGDEAVFVPVPGAGHRDVLDPTSSAWAPVVAYLGALPWGPAGTTAEP